MRATAVAAAVLAVLAVGVLAEDPSAEYIWLDSVDDGFKITTPITNIFAGKGTVTLGGTFPQTATGSSLNPLRTFMNYDAIDNGNVTDELYFWRNENSDAAGVKNVLKQYNCTTTLGDVQSDDVTLSFTNNFNITCQFFIKHPYGFSSPIARSVYVWESSWMDSNCANIPPAQVPTTGAGSITWNIRGPSGADGTDEDGKRWTSVRAVALNYVQATFAGLQVSLWQAAGMKSPSPMPMFKDLLIATNNYYDWYSEGALYYMDPEIWINDRACVSAGLLGLKPPLTFELETSFFVGAWLGDGTNMWTSDTDYAWGSW